MKALQKMVIRDTQYLLYYLRKIKQTIHDYNEFCSSEKLTERESYIIDIWKSCSVDLYPYLYTLNNISTTEFNSFIIYFIQHATLVDIDVSKIKDVVYKKRCDISNIDMFFSFTKGDKLMLISLLSVMQYYFI